MQKDVRLYFVAVGGYVGRLLGEVEFTGDLLVFTDRCEGIFAVVCFLGVDGASFALFLLDSTNSSKDMSLLPSCVLVEAKRLGLGEQRFLVDLLYLYLFGLVEMSKGAFNNGFRRGEYMISKGFYSASSSFQFTKRGKEESKRSFCIP